MNLGKSFSQTGSSETVLPIIYIEKYQTDYIKRLFEDYKFNKSKNSDYFKAKRNLQALVLDIIFECRNSFVHRPNTFLLFTSPPSTMYAQKEKSEDSMRELLREDSDWYSPVFTVSLQHIKNSKAQHIGGSRRKRLENTKTRYSVSWKCKFLIWYIYTYKKIHNFHFVIIDDVSSTGGTLLACKETLEAYLQKLQKKKPDLTWSIQVFSICH